MQFNFIANYIFHFIFNPLIINKYLKFFNCKKMPAAKRKLATQQPNSSSNDGQQQKSGVKRRKKPPTDEIVKEEPTITTMDPTMECFARMWADEDDDDEDDDQNNVENNNKGKETPPNTSTIAMAIKRKIRSKKRRIKRRESLKLAAASSSTTTAINYEVIEISDGEDLYQAFPSFDSNDAQPADENGATDEMKDEEKKEEEEEADNSEEIVVLFEWPRKEANEDETNGRQNGEATAAASSSSSATAKEMQQQNGNSPGKGIASLSSPPSATTPAIGEDGKIKWSSVYYVTLRPERKYLARIAKYKDKHRKAFKQFDKAIWEHLTQNIQNDHTFNWKMRVREFLHTTIRTIYPDCDLLAVGSTVNGCGAFNSDMDLCLCLPDKSWTPYYLPSTPAQGDLETQRKFATKHLKKVMKLLWKESKMIKFIQFIPAKVPILNIHFQTPYQTLEVDMNINNTPGIYNSYLLHYYSRIDDRLPALCLVIKHWAKKRGILDACNGFFNSYSLILMVLHFLQCAVEPPILPNLQAIYPNFFAFQKPTHEMQLFNELPFPLPDVPKNETTVGELLIAFFVYFNRFDFERDGISIRMGQTFRRANLAANTRRFKVYIEEPFDQQNTARCITNDEQWAFILGTFRDASVAMFSNQDRPPSLRYLI